MVQKYYKIEREGQIDFFDNYRIPYGDDTSVLIDNTDGVYHGNILEFKLNISNVGKILFQAIKYLSKLRIKGESVPARILLIDLNNTKVYVFNSIDYIDDIQKVYVGASSRNNDTFSKNVTPIVVYDYTNPVDSAEVKKLLINKVEKETDWYIPIDINEDCIVGWGERYYRENPNASKGDFLGDGTGKININGEIRDPKHFKGLINPYKQPTNQKFKYLMDCLNDRLNKKDLGAFYTPPAYCKKAAELVELAVSRVPDGNDYIILDRCAGTGNLQAALYGRYDKNGDELISHCVVSTYEYYEYKVLMERIGTDIREIIPPTEMNVVYETGKISNADAMSKEYIENPLIKKYVDNPKCTIILFENPPYTDDSGSTVETKKSRGNSDSFIAKTMNKYVPRPFPGLVQSKDLVNCFIWSGFHYYLRHATDSYIVFSPIKYWKTGHLVNSHFEKGYIFNRKHFHASASVITCSLWFNEDEDVEELKYKIVDINSDGNLQFIDKITAKKVHSSVNQTYFDKRKFSNDIEDGIWCKRDGSEGIQMLSTGTRNIYNDNILGWVHLIGFAFDSKNIGLVRSTLNLRNNGFYLRKDKYLEKLPLFCAKAYPQDAWYEKDIYSTSADGGDKYKTDSNLIKSCFLYTCLSNQNKCLSFNGSDGRYYRNELCFDTTHGDTVASSDLAKMKLDADEKELISIWNNILKEAKKTANYNSALTYGTYQIIKELNTSHEEGKGKSKKIIYDYPFLNGYLETLKNKLKLYYKSHITEKMFKYELLK